MNYKNFKLEDFLLDDAFKAWAKEGKNDTFWQSFFSDYPEQKTLAEQAKNMLLFAANQIDEPQKEKLKERIFQQIETQETAVEAKPSAKKRMMYWAAAASLALPVLTCLFLFQRYRNTEGHIQANENLVKTATVPLVESVNINDKPQLVVLSDKSTVLLQKGSSLSYPKTFEGLAKREVYLSGEAFFEVQKNPAQPFFVYADELVTKVVGTSFNIKAFARDNKIVVTVKTGKVSVFSSKAINQKARNPTQNALSQAPAEGVLLTPNQQIIFERTKTELLRTMVQTPVPEELSPIQKRRFQFDDTPVSEIFDILEKTYNIDIVYDEAVLAHCKLTATMDEEPFFEKLDLICLGIEAQYETHGGQIIISSKGCQVTDKTR